MVQSTQLNPNNRPVEYPEKVSHVVLGTARYKILHGGRGSSKSWSFAREIILRCGKQKLRVLCAREIQNSIKDSVYKLLVDQICDLKLEPYFNIGRDSITSSCGSEIFFKGLKMNIAEVKSMEGVDICWVEEAEKTSEESWTVLLPTIRNPRSEIWISFNPDDEKSATYTRFVKNTPPNSLIAEVNYEDNPWFPQVLREQMEYDKRVDYAKYLHVWEGKPRKYGNALIFKGKFRVEDFDTPKDTRFFHGADWGFANDPTCLVRCFIQDRKLYIDYEAYGIGVELDDTPALFDLIPTARSWPITADSARPETISMMYARGFNIEGAKKGKGSVEDGIEFLRSFEEIIIHPRCPHAYDNFDSYKWKTDKDGETILPIPVDANNHVPDAIRYALENLMQGVQTIFEVL